MERSYCGWTFYRTLSVHTLTATNRTLRVNLKMSNQFSHDKYQNYARYAKCSMCTSNQERDGVKFHSLPRNLDRARVWLQVAGVNYNDESIQQKRHKLYFCERHFHQNDYYNEQRTRLLPYAVPHCTTDIDRVPVESYLKSRLICGTHFDVSQYRTPEKKALNANAIPTVNLPTEVAEQTIGSCFEEHNYSKNSDLLLLSSQNVVNKNINLIKENIHNKKVQQSKPKNDPKLDVYQLFSSFTWSDDESNSGQIKTFNSDATDNKIDNKKSVKDKFEMFSSVNTEIINSIKTEIPETNDDTEVLNSDINEIFNFDQTEMPNLQVVEVPNLDKIQMSNSNTIQSFAYREKYKKPENYILNINSCRTCLYSGNELESIYDYIDELAECASIYVHSTDEFPKKICKICIMKLKEVSAFREQCQSSENVFLDALKKQKGLGNKQNLISSVVDTEKIDRYEENYIQNVTTIENINKITESTNENTDVQVEKFNTYTTNISDKRTNIINQDNPDIKYIQVSIKQLDCPPSQKQFSPRKCRFCGREFTVRLKYLRHMHTHTHKGKHLCHVCGKNFTSVENLERHTKLHTKIYLYKCPECPNIDFTRKSQLRQHVRKYHEEREKHTCDICGRIFCTSRTLERHIAKDHSEGQPNDILCTETSNICMLCGTVFKNYRSLYKHKKYKHGPSIYPCSYCDKMFKTKDQVNCHHLMHTNSRPHSCSLCGQSFRKKCSLDNHMKRKHSNSL